MTHTPGPWVVKYDARDYPLAIEAPNDAGIPGAVGCVVRARGIGLPSSNAAKANAKLIAAAPDLLAFAQYIANTNPGSRAPFFARARKVIAKATGVS